MTTTELPNMALSIRQPWAWAILYAGKDVENRSWQAVNRGLTVRGRIAIHASSGLGKSEYLDVASWMYTIGVVCPPARDLQRGGIIGSVEVVDVVRDYESKWFFGPRGLILANPEPCDFIPVKGCLGYFNWRDHITKDRVEPSAWMLPKKPKPEPHDSSQGSLL